MYYLTGTVLTLGYMAVFLFLIRRMDFFKAGTIPVRWFQWAFVLKVLSGFLLFLIYTYYYTDRSTADIWKYYDDGMVMYGALRQHPSDFFQMLFGIGNDGPHFEAYYDQMHNWYRPYGSSIANDTHTIIRFNALVRLFSLGHYNVHSVVANFLGLVGLTGIFQFLRQMAPTKERWFFMGVFLMPGMMFWASGVLKEPLLLLGLGLFLFGVMLLVENGFSVKRILMIALSLLLLFTVKSYALAAIVPGLMAWGISRRTKKLHPAIVFAAIYGFVIVGAVLFGKLSPEKDALQRLAQKQYEFYQLAEGGTYVETRSGDTLYVSAEQYDALLFSEDGKTLTLGEDVASVYWKDAKSTDVPMLNMAKGTELTVLLDYGRTGSVIDIPRLDPELMSILKAVPMALINATFRPFPQHIDSPFMLLAGFENLILLILLILAFVGACRGRSVHDRPIFYTALSFALVILILTGLVTPVVGAIVRYRVPALPFLACALLALIDTSTIEDFLIRRFPFIKKYL